jgi:hypothetical protein
MLTNTQLETLTTLLANIRYAARNHETVVIGGGEFTPKELTEAQAAVVQLLKQTGHVD